MLTIDELYPVFINSPELYKQWWNMGTLFPYKLADPSWICNPEDMTESREAYTRFVVDMLEGAEILQTLATTKKAKVVPVLVPKIEPPIPATAGRLEPMEFLKDINFLAGYKASPESLRVVMVDTKVSDSAKARITPSGRLNNLSQKDLPTFNPLCQEITGDRHKSLTDASLLNDLWIRVTIGSAELVLTPRELSEYISRITGHRLLDRFVVKGILNGLSITDLIGMSAKVTTRTSNRDFLTIVKKLFPDNTFKVRDAKARF